MDFTEKHIKILGTPWTVRFNTKEENPLLNDCDGYCDIFGKNIVVRTKYSDKYMQNDEEGIRVATRHEIIHAFLYESGLWSDSFASDDGWALNEEMVDWLAIQFPKIADVCLQLKVFA